MIRVLIVDDHGVIRTGLRTLLKSDPEVEVVGEAADGPEAFRLTVELKPNVLLLDIGMPGEDGIQVAKRLRASAPDVRVVFLTMHEDPALMREAIQVGAAGYVIKRAEEREILDAIHAAHRGDLYIHPAVARGLVESPAADRAVARPSGEPLTLREKDILRLLARGSTHRQIGEALGLPVQEVEALRSSVMKKLGFSSRVELVSFAEQHDLM